MARSLVQSSVFGAVLLVGMVSASGCGPVDPSDGYGTLDESLVGDFRPTGDTVVMEAEHFTGNVPQGSHNWVLATETNASGGQAVRATPDDNVRVDTGYVTASPRLDFRVVFAQTGTYSVWVRGRAGGAVVGNSDSVHAGLDGSAVASADRINGFTASFGWTKKTIDGVDATLSVGTTGLHTVNLWMRESGFVVDKIELTKMTTTPSGTGHPETTRETSCTDGVKNGTETDVDCGGTTCGKCASSKACAAGSDCLGGVCTGGVCQPTCTDGAKNGSESDVDCGGTTCGKCANGKACLGAGDCQSGACSGTPLVCQAGGVPPYKDPTQPVATRVSDLLGRMTLDEKIGQMTQSEQQTSTPAQVGSLFIGSVLSGADSSFSSPTATAWADLVDGYQSAAMSTRLGIPIIYGIDAVHGDAKVLGGTVFPHNVALGATRDAALIQQIGGITAQETRATGVLWTFAPALTVARDQRWGRAYESFGENPDLVRTMTTMITGLQGTSLSSVGSVLATAKHYVGDGGAMWGTGNNPGGTPIDRGDAQMTDAALQAIHLAPYPDAISKGVGSVMASFSSVNGTKMHANANLITTVLKGQLGFTGFVVSDWQAIDQLQGAFADKVRVAVNAGVDMFMMPDTYSSFISTLRDEVNAGRVTQTRIDDAVKRILTKKFELGLFEHPLADRSGASQIGSAAHRDVARTAVRESLVLLRNDNAFLPLSPTTTVCVTGNGADNLRAQMGAWTLGWQQPLTTMTGATTILQGITSVVGASRVVTSGCQVGIRVVSEMTQSYAEWYGDDADPHTDNSGTCTASGGCVVVIVGGRPMNLDAIWNDTTTRAVVMAWYPGSEGLGVAQVLYAVNGANFTGKLPVTWKVDATDTPVNFCSSTDTNTCGDTGAHYTSTDAAPATVRFRYGYGLTYGPPGPTCTDGIKNQTETDVDCGGPCTSKCATGKLCLANVDCQSSNCVSGVCQAPPPSCTDGIKNGTESDVDCGGSCTSKCANGKGCSANADCQSNNCVSSVCQPVANILPTVSVTAPINGSSVVAGRAATISANASDSDGTISSVQFFVGSTSLGTDTTSPYSVSWSVPTSLASYSLTARATDNAGGVTTSTAVGVTSTASCTDGVQNGSETGVDCGGSCAACATTSPCSGLCTSPIVFAGPSFSSGNLGTGTTCHQTTANLSGGNCGNFAAGRTFSVNGTTMSCMGNFPSLPAKRNGGYCFQASAGNEAWAYFTTW